MVKYQLIANANSSPNTQIICWWTLKLREYYNPLCDVQFTFFGWWKLNRRLQYSIAQTCLLKTINITQTLKLVSQYLSICDSRLPLSVFPLITQLLTINLSVSVWGLSLSFLTELVQTNEFPSSPGWLLSPGRDIFYILHPTNWPWPHQGARPCKLRTKRHFQTSLSVSWV